MDEQQSGPDRTFRHYGAFALKIEDIEHDVPLVR